MSNISIRGLDSLSFKAKKITKSMIDQSTSDIEIGDDVYDKLARIQIRAIKSLSTKFDSNRFKQSNEYTRSYRDRTYISTLVDTKFYYGAILDEMYISDIEDVFNTNVHKAVWYKFFGWMMSRRTTKHVVIVTLHNKYNTNFMGGYVDLIGKERDPDVFATATIHYVNFNPAIYESIENDANAAGFYKYINNIFKTVFMTKSTIDLPRALEQVPEESLVGIGYTVGKSPKNPILLNKFDSNSSSKGGVNGFLTKTDLVEQRVCSTCRLTGFECPNHVTYVKSTTPLFNFAPLSVTIDPYRNSYNNIISWVYLMFRKKHEIESFIYDQREFNITKTCNVILNGVVYTKNASKSLLVNSDRIKVEGDLMTTSTLFNDILRLMKNPKIFRWARKYKIIEVLGKCKTNLVPILPPRLYRTPAVEKADLHSNYMKFMSNNKNISEITNAMYKTGEHHLSIFEMISAKHMSAENNLLVRRYNTGRWILGGNVFIHPSEVVVSGNACDSLSIVVEATRSNIPNLSNARINYIMRFGKKIKGKKIKPGDLVYRRLIDGVDVAIVKREPVLDEASLYAARVRRTNDTNNAAMMIPNFVAKRLNGDFDGDEGNAIIATSSENSDIMYKNLGIEHKPLTTYTKTASVGLHMDSFLFMYLISTSDKFEFPIMNLMFPKSSRVVLPMQKPRKYVNRFYGPPDTADYQIVDRLIIDYDDIEFDITSINSPTKDDIAKSVLVGSFKRLNVADYPYMANFYNLNYDKRVEYLKNCVGFVRMSGYNMLEYLFKPFPGINVDRTHVYSKSDFEYSSENIMTDMFRNFDSTLVMDWLWIVSNLASMFLTHNTQYATLKIEDIVEDSDISSRIREIEDDLFREGEARKLIVKYDVATAPTIKFTDMQKRLKFFGDIDDKIKNMISGLEIPSDNTLYNQAHSGSKGNPEKFDKLYHSAGALITPGAVLPHSLTDQVNCYDDYKDISRYGIITESMAGGMDPRAYLHQMAVMHIALQQTPLETKETGSVEKSLTPFLGGLFLRNGILENQYRRLLPWQF